jgi:hypothetical protein
MDPAEIGRAIQSAKQVGLQRFFPDRPGQWQRRYFFDRLLATSTTSIL